MQLRRDERPATVEEQRTLARWSGWGAVPEVFDDAKPDLARERIELHEMLGEHGFRLAARSTLNAHYTDLELVRTIWSTVSELGFTGGRVLEPGCGSGNFLALAPDGASVIGVEQEPVTAAIAAALYPSKTVRAESFAETRLREGSVDLVVGNVPFGKLALTDPRHNRGSHSIHNHFIIKALHLTKPGGMVAVLTSRWTLDQQNPAARREMADLADLLGAVRLPNGAHERAAGTDALTDLLVLRRRAPGREAAVTAESWSRTETVMLEGGEARINTYFLNRPHQVLGELAVGQGAYNAETLLVRRRGAPGELPEQLRSVLHEHVVQPERLAPVEAPSPTEPGATPAVATVGAPSDLRDGYLDARADGTFTRVEQGELIEHEVPKSQAAELRQLLGLRDAIVGVLETEAASPEDTSELVALRHELNQRYDGYVQVFGSINRFTLRRTGRVDPETGEDRTARITPRQGGFRLDPFSPPVYALEHFDSATQTATKADVFTRRVVAPRTPRKGADNPSDALAICLDTHGRVDLDEVARLLGVDPVEARTRLGTAVFDDPASEQLIPAAEYLSGNVRAKLRHAVVAAGDDGRFSRNVEALREVIPEDLAPEQIEARLGAAWIEASYVQDFLRDLVDDPRAKVEHPGGATWGVSARSTGVLATDTWGTSRAPAPDLIKSMLQQQSITVFDTVGEDKKRVLNLEATVAAQEKASEIAERFSTWVWEDPTRADELARTYNDTFNAIVLRSYDGAELSLPGLALSFTPRPHQYAAVARMVHEPAVGLFHEVGAGKTAEMAMGCMELRRLGFVAKPAVVVPNNMLEQFGREFGQLYPRARLLVATNDDLTRERRRHFVARVANGDWDAVIMTRSAFERIPLSREAQEAYLEREGASLRAQLENMRSEGAGLTVKRMESALANAEERVKKKLDAVRDDGITFEQTGIDYVVVDEAHGYKNLRTPSSIRDAAIEGSNRAQDLDMKLDHLRRRSGARVATLATATPIANSITETYVMQRYVRPDLLEDAGIEVFDQWAATFGQVTQSIELSPDGGRFRLQQRFAKFVNVPELLKLWFVGADIKTAEDLQLPTPQLQARPEDGARTPQTVLLEPTARLVEFVGELGERADAVRAGQVEPDQDNMLKISSDGRLAALDLRLRDMEQGDPSKVSRAAEEIALRWREHRDDVFPLADGSDHPTRGALQIVFCDIGTPSRLRWNAYDALREELVKRGLLRESVRFMHEASTDQAKAALFAAARSGEVAVLVGSTERMGVGTNVQARAVALHHLDCPWRPADLRQREGRILRQGNHYDEVEILRYATERSFDGYSWQTVERKARFIAQVMRGRLDTREIDDVGDAALSFNEVKALASGDPRVMEKAQIDAEVNRLERLRRAHVGSQMRLQATIGEKTQLIERSTDAAERIAEAISRRVSTRGDAFRATITGRVLTERTPAGERLLVAVAEAMADPIGTSRHLGILGGLTLQATVEERLTGARTIRIELVEAPGNPVSIERGELATARPGGVIAQLENRVASLHQQLDKAHAAITDAREQIDQARARVGLAFPHAEALAKATARAAELHKEMQALAAPPTPPEPTAEPTAEPAPGASEVAAAAGTGSGSTMRDQMRTPPSSQRVGTSTPFPARVTARVAADVERTHSLDAMTDQQRLLGRHAEGALGRGNRRAAHRALAQALERPSDQRVVVRGVREAARELTRQAIEDPEAFGRVRGVDVVRPDDQGSADVDHLELAGALAAHAQAIRDTAARGDRDVLGRLYRDLQLDVDVAPLLDRLGDDLCGPERDAQPPAGPRLQHAAHSPSVRPPQPSGRGPVHTTLSAAESALASSRPPEPPPTSPATGSTSPPSGCSSDRATRATTPPPPHLAGPPAHLRSSRPR